MFSPNIEDKKNNFLVQNSSFYSFSSQQVFPTLSMFLEYFIKPISTFKQKNTIVVIGNSLMIGSGSIEKNYITKKLSNNYNVINSALNGENIRASIDLAMVGLKEEMKFRPNPVNIVYGYVFSRTYFDSNYSNHAKGLENLSTYFGLENFTLKSSFENRKSIAFLKETLFNFYSFHSKCLIQSSFLIQMISSFNFFCAHPLTLEEREVGFLSQHQFYKTMKEKERMRSVFKDRDSLGFLFNEQSIESKINNFENSHSQFKKFRNAFKIRSIESFFLVDESPQLLALLNKNDQLKLIEQKNIFIERFKSRFPDINFYWVKDLPPHAYFDATHLNDYGQSILADFIKERLSPLSNL